MVDVLLSLLFLAFTYTRAIAAGVCRSGAGLSRQQSPQGRKEAAQCRNEMRHTTKRNGWYTKGGKWIKVESGGVKNGGFGRTGHFLGFGPLSLLPWPLLGAYVLGLLALGNQLRCILFRRVVLLVSAPKEVPCKKKSTDSTYRPGSVPWKYSAPHLWNKYYINQQLRFCILSILNPRNKNYDASTSVVWSPWFPVHYNAGGTGV